MDRVVATDINNDSLIDIIAQSDYYGKTRVLINKGDGSYEKTTMKVSGQKNSFSSFGDYDKDGDTDILYIEETSYFDGRISILNNDKGEFKKEVISNEYNEVIGEIVDFDNDGDNDLCLFTNKSFHPGILIFENTTPPSRIKDFNSLNVEITPTICTSHINITCKGYFTYSIVYVNGRQIEKGNSRDEKFINSTNWENGAYYILVENGSNRSVGKVIKVK